MTITREDIEQILKGTEGVTPGPWKWEGSIYEHMGAGIRSLPDDRGFAQLWQHGNVVLDAAHIANCSPEVIRELCRGYLLGMEAEWQPIETAPKDGTMLILRLETSTGQQTHVGNWEDDTRPWRIYPSGYWSSVTAWRPLPTPPLPGEV